jgi:S-adenosylmethionine:tRNA ribosyltransferase-isomerase
MSALHYFKTFTFYLSMLSLSNYDYTLPDHLIAQHPVLPPENASLLVFDRKTETISHKHFYDLPWLLTPDTLIVFNDSKVVKARVLFPEIQGELLFLRLLTPTSCEAMVRPWKKWKNGMSQTIAGTTITFTVTDTTIDWRIVECSHPILRVLEQYGQMPLPPYIEYDPNDADHYQSVVADDTKPWSVAAPTAALHFSPKLLSDLQKSWINKATVTLHVWIGTFKSVDVEDITKYAIHDEVCEVSLDLFTTIARQKLSKKPLLAVWTTTTRTLESLPYVWKLIEKNDFFDQETILYRNRLTNSIDWQHASQYVSEITLSNNICFFHCTLYIYPGFQFCVIDQLITNFHLPKSSLLMLVAGYIWYEQMQTIYKHAISQEYRFFSFGDGMLVM